jgi:pyruvate kinase
MVLNPKATEAEVFDIAASVKDGVDCILLDRETSHAKNGHEAVTQLAKICSESEMNINFKKDSEEIRVASPTSYGTAESTAGAAVQICTDLKIDLIIV